MKLFDSGVCYPFIGRDCDGRKVVRLNLQRLNLKSFSLYDVVRLFSVIVTTLLEEEETQIAGFIFILDFANITLKHMMTPFDLLDLIDFQKKCTIAKQRKLIVMNLPAFANAAFGLFKSLLSKKVNSRLLVLKNDHELHEHIDPSLLVTDYGGSQLETEILQKFLDFRDDHCEMLQKFWSFKVDWSKVSHQRIWSSNRDEGGGVIESFRRLEID